MTPGRGLTSVPLRLKLLLLIAGPLVVAVGVGFGVPERWIGAGAGSDLADQTVAFAVAFEQLMQDATAVTASALDSDPRRVFRRPGPSRMAGRLEGIGVLDAQMSYLDWAGTPPEPGPIFDVPDPPPWSIRMDGVRTRLVVRAGPDDRGRFALASFIVDGRLPDSRFDGLLPPELLARAGVVIEFRDTEAATTDPGDSIAESIPESTDAGAAEPPGSRLILRSPTGDLLATAILHAVPPDHLRAARIEAGRAWAAVLLLFLVALLFEWSTISRSWRGWFAVLLVLFAGRLLLLLLRVPATLLPRELGSAVSFGTPAAEGLLASPADLALTALAFLLFALSARVVASAFGDHRRGLAHVFRLLCATAVTAVLFWMVISVAHHAARPVLERPGISGWDPASTIVLGLALAILGAAELWAALWEGLRGTRVGQRRRPRLSTVAILVILLAAACSVTAQELTTSLGLDRLRSELAPQVLEQSSRRSLALSAAVRHVDETFRNPQGGRVPLSSRDSFLAYHFWVTGALFLSGYKSSLTFYTPTGEMVSHFGFDLPALYEEIEADLDAPGELTIKDEDLPLTTFVVKNVLHAEITVVRDGEPLGVVVGHVLDEPENLPFLPWSQPYLSALGPGAPYPSDDPFIRDLQYVLYDERGVEVLSSLLRPPADTSALRQAAAAGEAVRVMAGDEHRMGLALEDHGGRLHLLLIPARGWLDRLAAWVRLALIGLFVLAVFAVVPRLASRRFPRDLLTDLRGSFHRKLLAALLAASVIPLVGLALFLRGYVERRGETDLIASATQFVGAAQRQLEDYAAVSAETGGLARLNDEIVYWMRRLVGQEIHVFDNGVLRATSKRELFASGLLSPRIDGEVYRRLVEEGRPNLVVPTRIGPAEIPVAYAPVRTAVAGRERVVAVPTVFEQRQIARGVDRVAEMILLATVLLVGLLAVAATYLARTVARPVRELVGATGRIAAGDYGTRLRARTRDEVADLVRGFNSMADSLADQRADLERQRDHMERLLRHATTGVISVDSGGRIVTLNPAARQSLSAAGSRLRDGADLVSALSSTRDLEPLAACLAKDPPMPGAAEDVDLELDGSPHRYRLVRVNLPEPSGGTAGQLILLEDITDLMRSNQLAAWAEMAQAIAHEIKNPLTPIQLSTEHLRRVLRDRGLLPDADMDTCLDTVMKQVQMLYQIAGEFSAYAKLPALQPEPSDPVAFMRAVIGPYRSSEPPDITIRERYEAAGNVAIDERVLSRAVVNLVENALHAMPDGGTLTVSVHPDPDRNEAVLSVTDTGTGLHPDVRKRLFDPYFSTKSSGTGLGLAIARRAVEAHQGTIEVDSAQGRGTSFTIRLPLIGAS